MDAGIPDVVKAAWATVEANWDDASKHDALLALVAQYSCFAWAAAQYKPRAGDPVADKQLERLRKAATATMLATATQRPDTAKTPYRSSLFLLLFAVILIGVGVVYAMSRQHRDTPADTTDVQH